MARWLFCILIILTEQSLFSQNISDALVSKKADKIEEPSARDPLGRDTPRGTIFGFVRYSRREDYTTAAQYLQPTYGKDPEAVARELQELMDLKFRGRLEFISDKPEGSIDDGLPLDRDRVGTIEFADRSVNLILVRTQDSASKRMIWLISEETVVEAQSLYTEIQPSPLVRYLPEVTTTNYFLYISAAQWIGWLLSIPAAYFLAWCIVLLLRLLYRVIPEDRRAKGPKFASFRSPFRFICFVILHAYFVYLLRIPLFYRWYYLRFVLALFFGGAFWLASRGVEVFFGRAVGKLGSWAVERASMLVLVSRMIRVGVFILAVIAIATVLGFDTKAMLAGVGIGGLAIALAGQKTLENVIGGVSLLLDRAVHVGDTCRIGDKLGKVEDIGLRSLRLRMLDQTLVVVPNGVLAQVQFENLTSRTKLLIQNRFSVRSETPVEKLQAMLDSLQHMLDQLAYVERCSSRIRIVRFAGAATEIELFAYILTTDWAKFTVLRQNVMIKALEIVEAEGIRLTGTTQLSYVEVASESHR
ncbi:MAG: mechanosensitive ion channel [Terriglobia bacterium]|nr:mechanosensitive ion channel [Terriglobia bacterium]